MAKEKKVSGGITFVGALQVLFIGLKLAGFIGWSWWLVLLPIEVEVAVLALCFEVLGIIAYIESRGGHGF